MDMTIEELERMGAVDILAVNIEDLTDIRDIRIDAGQSVPDKMRQYAAQAGNVFFNRHGDYIVKVSYADTDATVNDKMKKHVSGLAEIRC